MRVRNVLFVCLLLSSLLSSLAEAGDLAMVRERNGRWASYAAGDAGFHREAIDLPTISHLALGGGLARVSRTGTELLYAATDAGVAVRRIDEELGRVSTFHLGDRLAVVKGRKGWAVYGSARDRIAAYFLRDSHVRNIQVKGNLAYIRTSRNHLLFAPSDEGVVISNLGSGSPRQIRLARNMAATVWSNGTFLHAVTPQGIETIRLPGGNPRQIRLGGEAAEAPASE